MRVKARRKAQVEVEPNTQLPCLEQNKLAVNLL